MVTPLDVFFNTAEIQLGAKYEYGAEVSVTNSVPKAFDSSELVEYAAHRAGITAMPDGSWNQFRALHNAGASMEVNDALHIKGALVFGFSSDPLDSSDRPARAYVGISTGDGKTVIDVSERGGQVQVVEHGGFYTHAAVIPGLHSEGADGPLKIPGAGWIPKPVDPPVDPNAADPNAADPNAPISPSPEDNVCYPDEPEPEDNVCYPEDESSENPLTPPTPAPNVSYPDTSGATSLNEPALNESAIDQVAYANADPYASNDTSYGSDTYDTGYSDSSGYSDSGGDDLSTV